MRGQKLSNPATYLAPPLQDHRLITSKFSKGTSEMVTDHHEKFHANWLLCCREIRNRTDK